MKSEEASLIVKQKKNILHIINRKNANLIGHILFRNCLLKQVNEGNVEGRIEMMEREEEGVNSHWVTLSKREDNVT